MSVLIQRGRIITASDDYVADVYMEDETVTLIGTALDVDADRVIDASGKYVLPGCIDPHTHFDMPLGDRGMAREGGRQGDDRLRLPHHRRRSRGRNARRPGDAPRPGRHLLQD